MSPVTQLLSERYELSELIGHGGMADVYRAVDRQTQQPVAVKVLRSDDAELVGRLVREARTLARLAHPGLVRLLDTGTSGGRAFLVMELVEGPTLATEIRRGPMPTARVAQLGAQLADALGYVHARGVVHRDVKPGNVLLDGDGRARLADFGIARLLDETAMTSTGTTLGTAAYMAPEQLRHHRVGRPADVWSLGMVLLECLVGRRLFEGSPAAVVARRLAAPVVVPADLPAPWRMLLRAMLDDDPGARPSATHAAELLRASAFGEPWTVVPGAGRGGVVGTDRGAPAGEATAVADTAPATVATAIAPPPLRPASDLPAHLLRRRRHRHWWLAAALAVVAAGAVGIAAAVAGAPAATTRLVPRSSSPSTTAAGPPPAPVTSTPPTTLPTPASAIGTLVTDVGRAEAAGQLDAALGQQVDTAAATAVAAAAAGSLDTASAALGQAATALSRGVSAGATTATEASVLLGDLQALAGVLGLPPSAATPAPPPTTAPRPTRRRDG